MDTYRVFSTRTINEYWFCDVEADSEQEAIDNYDFINETCEDSEVSHFEIIDVEKLEDDDK